MNATTEKTQVKISLRFAAQAQEIFRDMFSAFGEAAYTDCYEFESSDMASEFVEALEKSGIPSTEMKF